MFPVCPDFFDVIMAKPKYHLHLKGYVGGWDFDSDYVDYIVEKYKDESINVLIDSTGGYVGTALSVAAAFRRHGNVSVHFVGLNASAATLASLGAKHISIDKAAMYLVHKCSSYFFEWGQKNADQYEQLIKDVSKIKEDLDKFDLNAAQQYASRCKRKPEDMLALMAKGGWLTAQEALEWGFVDEITDLEDDSNSLQVTENLVEAMLANGLDLPENLQIAKAGKSSAFSQLLKMITSPFKKEEEKKENRADAVDEIQNKDQDDLEPLNNSVLIMKVFALLCGLLSVEAIAVENEKAFLTEDQLQAIEDALNAKDNKIKDLENSNKELKEKLDAKPAAESSTVIEDKKTEKTEKNDLDSYIDDWNESKKIYDALP